MRGFVYIYSKAVELDVEVDSLQKQINDLKNVKHIFDVYSSKKMTGLYYTNESKEFLNSEYQKEDNQVSLIGQYAVEEGRIISKFNDTTEEERLRYVSDLSGAFAIGIANFNSDTLEFYTHIFRIDNIFLYESDSHIVVGTDPLIVSAVSNIEYFKPIVEVKNAVSFLMNGYFADEKTLFKDVNVLPPNSQILIKENQVVNNPIDDAIEKISTRSSSKDLNNKLKENFINAYKVVPEDVKINLGVTGGKDSRLALLGLLDSGYAVSTVTRGFESNPDVIIAKEITKKLELEHKVIEPKISREKGLDVNVQKRALQAMIATSGQVYGYEGIGFNPKYSGKQSVSGVGALTLKGGYSNLNHLKPKNSVAELEKRFSPFRDILKEGIYDDYAEFLSYLGREDFQKAQYKHALFYRNGRWTSGTRLAKSYSSVIHSPFYDNQLTKTAMVIDKNLLDNGFVQYTLTKKLNSKIANMKLAASRWGFEARQPVKPEGYKVWLKKTPLYPETTVANFNWRNLSNKQNDKVLQEFRKILLKRADHPIFEVVDYDKLVEKFETGIPNTYSKFLWALMSLYVYINHLNGEAITSDPINISLPSSEVKQLHYMPKTVDLMDDIIPLNKTLNIESKGSSTLVKMNDKATGNKYLTTFNKGLTRGSSHEKAKIKGWKNIFFNMFMNTTAGAKIKYCIIFFNGTEKIRTDWFNKKVTSNDKNLEGEIQIPLNADNFKIAYKIPNELNGINMEIKYFYYTLK